MIWKFKSCPRCDKGDLYLDEDLFEKRKYWGCLQCGYHSQFEPDLNFKDFEKDFKEYITYEVPKI
jgi:Zn ribbon nucleic-acid-binding protein